MCARFWLELPYSGLSNPNPPSDSKQTSCKHVKSVPQTVQAYRRLSANDTKLLSDNILRVITRTVTYCRKQWNPVKKASNTNKLKYMKDSKVRYGQSSLKTQTIWLLRGGMGDLVLVRIFSPKRLVIEFFPGIQWCKIYFFSFVHLERYFFHQVLPCKNFFPSKSVCRIFFPEITHTHSKVKWSAPKQTPLGKRKKVSMTENVAYCNRVFYKQWVKAGFCP